MSGLVVEDIHLSRENAAIFLNGHYFLQIRTGAMTVPALNAFLEHITQKVAALPDQRLASLHIVDGQAPLPDADVRDRQRGFMREIMRNPNLSVATVIEGEGVQATASRAVIRLLVLGNTRMRHDIRVEDAAAWVARQVGANDADELVAAVATLRARMATLP